MTEDGREGELGTIDRAPEVDIHKLPDNAEVGVFEKGTHADAGIVDENVYPIPFGNNPEDEGLAVRLFADIGLYGKDIVVCREKCLELL